MLPLFYHLSLHFQIDHPYNGSLKKIILGFNFFVADLLNLSLEESLKSPTSTLYMPYQPQEFFYYFRDFLNFSFN